MFDNELMLRSGAAHLTADEAIAYAAYPKCPYPLEVRVIVPEMAEAGDTIDITFTLSDDGAIDKEVIHMPQITKAGVTTSGITEYFLTLPMVRDYIKCDIDITDADAGGDFDAGHVQIGLVPAGRHLVR